MLELLKLDSIFLNYLFSVRFEVLTPTLLHIRDLWERYSELAGKYVITE